MEHTTASNLHWTDDRWHDGERPIHAGDRARVRASNTDRWDDQSERYVSAGPGEWVEMRIESRDCGRVLLGFYELHGLTLMLRIGPEHELHLA